MATVNFTEEAKKDIQGIAKLRGITDSEALTLIIAYGAGRLQSLAKWSKAQRTAKKAKPAKGEKPKAAKPAVKVKPAAKPAKKAAPKATAKPAPKAAKSAAPKVSKPKKEAASVASTPAPIPVESMSDAPQTATEQPTA